MMQLRISIRRILFLCAVTSVLAGNRLATSAFQASTVIEGIVVDIETDAPLSGVSVSLSAASKVSVTDAEGKFSFSGIAPGRYLVMPTLSNFVYSRPNGYQSSQDAGFWIQVEGGKNISGIRVRMGRQGAITGSIQPTGGAAFNTSTGSVQLLQYRYSDFGERRLSTIANAGGTSFIGKLDDRGQYRLFGLPAGDYFLRVISSNLSGTKWNATYYPSGEDEMRAVPIHVRTGEEIHLAPIYVVPYSLIQTSFQFAMPDGLRPNSVASVTIDGQITLSVPVRNGPAVLVPLAPGRHDVLFSFSSPGTTSPLFYSSDSLTVAEPSKERTIALSRAANISGSILLEDDAGNKSSLAGVRCTLQSLKPSVSKSGSSGCIGGQFSPGLYHLDVTGIGVNTYVKSALSGNQDILSGIQINADAEIKIQLGTNGGSVKGTVADANGKKLPDAVVAIVPDVPLRQAGLLHKSVTSDVNGNFEIQGIRPGAYHLFAWSELEGAAYRNESYMKQLEDQGTAIKIEQAERASVSLTAVRKNP